MTNYINNRQYNEMRRLNLGYLRGGAGNKVASLYKVAPPRQLGGGYPCKKPVSNKGDNRKNYKSSKMIFSILLFLES